MNGRGRFLKKSDSEALLRSRSVSQRSADRTPFQDIVSDTDKVLLVGLKTDDIPQQRFEDKLQELVRLVETAGGIVVDTVEHSSKPSPSPNSCREGKS